MPNYKRLLKYIEFKYFNDEFPENKNIKYENNNCLIREDGKWKSKNLNNMILDIIENEEEKEDNKDINDKYIRNELKVLIKSSKTI